MRASSTTGVDLQALFVTGSRSSITNMSPFINGDLIFQARRACPGHLLYTCKLSVCCWIEQSSGHGFLRSRIAKTSPRSVLLFGRLHSVHQRVRSSRRCESYQWRRSVQINAHGGASVLRIRYVKDSVRVPESPGQTRLFGIQALTFTISLHKVVSWIHFSTAQSTCSRSTSTIWDLAGLLWTPSRGSRRLPAARKRVWPASETRAATSSSRKSRTWSTSRHQGRSLSAPSRWEVHPATSGTRAVVM